MLQILTGSEEGWGTLFLTNYAGHASTVPRGRRFRKLRILKRTLDGLIRDKMLQPPDVIKIDVGGSELSVLKGARDLLAAQQPSLIFENNEIISRMGFETEDLLRPLRDAGHYRFFVIEQSGALEEARSPYPFGDILALSPRHIERL